MKTLAKRLKAERKKNAEIVKKIEGMVRVNRKGEELIHNRDVEIERLRAQLTGSTRYIYAMAQLIGDEFFLPFSVLNQDEFETHGIRMEDNGLVFVKK